jgi:hypothetical protein
MFLKSRAKRGIHIATKASAEFREKQIKKYRREKKIALFRECNPQWKDLSPELFGPTRKTRGAVADNELGADSPPNLISTDMDPSLRSGLKRKT